MATSSFAFPCTWFQQMRITFNKLLLTHTKMSQRAIGVAVGLAAACATNVAVKNDTGKRRAFYEDEEAVNVFPGTTTPLDAAASEKLGQQYVLEGVTVRTTNSVQNAIKSARESVVGAFRCAENWLNNGKAKYIESERSVSDTLSSLHEKREDLLPNSIYIAVAGLSGNIFARNRGPIARFFVPTILGLGAFKYFLPHTFSNTVGLLWKVEQRTLPEVAQQQVSAYNTAHEWAKKVESSAVEGQHRVSSGLESAKRKLASASGLNLDEEVTKK
ncbi:hypothetical protein CJI97_003772 [Candidozyma auris]|uniref:MICOS complex subunit n=2 Tax=Candidozyma auris TaxID=498019 RepID=A0A2H0ZTQ8_CANAR|nr:hypothetical protein QG37_04929 [[Candida] auris]PIS52086.1 hypothetical protein B9J08_003697 [[Candida] auris]PIS54074.1 hypothetical protein CJI97_003772 [[Candida] auris]